MAWVLRANESFVTLDEMRGFLYIQMSDQCTLLPVAYRRQVEDPGHCQVAVNRSSRTRSSPQRRRG